MPAITPMSRQFLCVMRSDDELLTTSFVRISQYAQAHCRVAGLRRYSQTFSVIWTSSSCLRRRYIPNSKVDLVSPHDISLRRSPVGFARLLLLEQSPLPRDTFLIGAFAFHQIAVESALQD